MWNQLRAGAILRASWLLAFYLAGVAWLTWPLAGSLSSVLPCPTGMFMHDIYYSTWALAHESHALLTAPWRIADANIYHPTPSALFYGPAGLGALPLFAPVFLATGNPTLAINVTFLVGLALTGAAMHVVVRRWTGSRRRATAPTACSSSPAAGPSCSTRWCRPPPPPGRSGRPPRVRRRARPPPPSARRRRTRFSHPLPAIVGELRTRGCSHRIAVGQESAPRPKLRRPGGDR